MGTYRSVPRWAADGPLGRPGGATQPDPASVRCEASARLAHRMAGPLAAIERFFERFLERPAARLFQARLEPVQIQRQLERAMESERRLGSHRTYVPSSYQVLLSPADLLAFESY